MLLLLSSSSHDVQPPKRPRTVREPSLEAHADLFTDVQLALVAELQRAAPRLPSGSAVAELLRNAQPAEDWLREIWYETALATTHCYAQGMEAPLETHFPRPFIDELLLHSRLLHWAHSQQPLVPGSLLHVPVSREEASVILQCLQNARRAGASWESALERASCSLAGRSVADCRRFLQGLPQFNRSSQVCEWYLTKCLTYAPLARPSRDSTQRRSLVMNGTLRELGFGRVRPVREAALAARRLQLQARSSVPQSVPTLLRLDPCWDLGRQQLVSGSPAPEQELVVFDLTRGTTCALAEGHGSGLQDAAWTAQGSHLLTSGLGGSVRVWDPVTWTSRELVNWSLPGAPVEAMLLGLQPHAEHIVAVTSSERHLEVRDIATGQLMCDFSWHGSRANLGDIRTFPGTVCNLGFFTDALLATLTFESKTHPGELQLYDVEQGRCVAVGAPHKGSSSDMAVAPGHALATAAMDGCVCIFDPRRSIKSPASRLSVLGWPLSGQSDGRSDVHVLSWSPNKSLLAAALSDNCVCVFDTRVASGSGESSELVKLWHTTSAYRADSHQGVADMCWTSDGLLVSGGEDKLVRVWDPASATSAAVLPGHTAEVTAIAARDGLVVSAGDDKSICMFVNEGTSALRLKLA